MDMSGMLFASGILPPTSSAEDAQYQRYERIGKHCAHMSIIITNINSTAHDMLLNSLPQLAPIIGGSPQMESLAGGTDKHAIIKLLHGNLEMCISQVRDVYSELLLAINGFIENITFPSASVSSDYGNTATTATGQQQTISIPSITTMTQQQQQQLYANASTTTTMNPPGPTNILDSPVPVMTPCRPNALQQQLTNGNATTRPSVLNNAEITSRQSFGIASCSNASVSWASNAKAPAVTTPQHRPTSNATSVASAPSSDNGLSHSNVDSVSIPSSPGEEGSSTSIYKCAAAPSTCFSYAKALKMPTTTDLPATSAGPSKHGDFAKIEDGELVKHFWTYLKEKAVPISMSSLGGLVSSLPNKKEAKARIKNKYGNFSNFLLRHKKYFHCLDDQMVSAVIPSINLAAVITAQRATPASSSAIAPAPTTSGKSSILAKCKDPKDRKFLYHEWKASGFKFEKPLFEDADFQEQYVRLNFKWESERVDGVLQYLSLIKAYATIFKHANSYISFGCGPCADLSGVKNFVKSTTPQQSATSQSKVYIGVDVVDWNRHVVDTDIMFLQDDVTRPRFFDDFTDYLPRASSPGGAGSGEVTQMKHGGTVFIISFLAARINLHHNHAWWERAKEMCDLIVVLDLNENELNESLRNKGFTKYNHVNKNVPVNVFKP